MSNKYTVTYDTTWGSSDVRRDGKPFISELPHSIAEMVASECNTLAADNARLRKLLTEAKDTLTSWEAVVGNDCQWPLMHNVTLANITLNT